VALTVIFPGLSLMCVCPRFQRRGTGQLLMGWGLARIDSLGLESFIEASDFGKGLYTRCGFRPVTDVSVKMNVAGASEEWENYRRSCYLSNTQPRGGRGKRNGRMASHKSLGISD